MILRGKVASVVTDILSGPSEILYTVQKQSFRETCQLSFLLSFNTPLNSPSLGWQVKQNMMRPLYQATGVTHYQSPDGTDYVYVFGGRVQARWQGDILTDIVR